MISEIYILFFKASLTIRHTATVSQKKSGTSKKNQWDFQISRVGSLDFLDLKVNGSPGSYLNLSSAAVCYVISEKDWEDIRKMPEYNTLMKDFKRNK